jgi:hypothetical protein
MTAPVTRDPTVEDFFDEINAINDYAQVIYKFSERPGEISKDDGNIICRIAGLITDKIKPMMAALDAEQRPASGH